ncbi:hypothetical protein BU17DRAFT_70152 [Hysterangium stoloniferum]|nr:hypothetical protein BU17DRAFT_70152 [Hysterangium stoloniferum]
MVIKAMAHNIGFCQCCYSPSWSHSCSQNSCPPKAHLFCNFSITLKLLNIAHLCRFATYTLTVSLASYIKMCGYNLHILLVISWFPLHQWSILKFLSFVVEKLFGPSLLPAPVADISFSSKFMALFKVVTGVKIEPYYANVIVNLLPVISLFSGIEHSLEAEAFPMVTSRRPHVTPLVPILMTRNPIAIRRAYIQATANGINTFSGAQQGAPENIDQDDVFNCEEMSRYMSTSSNAEPIIPTAAATEADPTPPATTSSCRRQGNSENVYRKATEMGNEFSSLKVMGASRNTIRGTLMLCVEMRKMNLQCALGNYFDCINDSKKENNNIGKRSNVLLESVLGCIYTVSAYRSYSLADDLMSPPVVPILMIRNPIAIRHACIQATANSINTFNTFSRAQQGVPENINQGDVFNYEEMSQHMSASSNAEPIISTAAATEADPTPSATTDTVEDPTPSATTTTTADPTPSATTATAADPTADSINTVDGAQQVAPENINQDKDDVFNYEEMPRHMSASSNTEPILSTATEADLTPPATTDTAADPTQSATIAAAADHTADSINTLSGAQQGPPENINQDKDNVFNYEEMSRHMSASSNAKSILSTVAATEADPTPPTTTNTAADPTLYKANGEVLHNLIYAMVIKAMADNIGPFANVVILLLGVIHAVKIVAQGTFILRLFHYPQAAELIAHLRRFPIHALAVSLASYIKMCGYVLHKLLIISWCLLHQWSLLEFLSFVAKKLFSPSLPPAPVADVSSSSKFMALFKVVIGGKIEPYYANVIVHLFPINVSSQLKASPLSAGGCWLRVRCLQMFWIRGLLEVDQWRIVPRHGGLNHFSAY